MASHGNPAAGGTARGTSEDFSAREVSDDASKPSENQAVIIGEFAANSREIARISLDCYRGHDLIKIQKWWPDELGELRPGKSVVALNVRHLPKLAGLLTAALARARELGLIEPEREGHHE
jgi:hypothetical protein